MLDDSRDLAHAASRGDTPAVESLYARHVPAFRAFVRLRMGRELRAREAESDIVQSVFREVVEDMGELEWRGEAAFKHWLYEKGLRKIIDKGRHWRAERRDARREIASRDSLPSVEECYRSLGTPSEMAMGREAIDRLEAAFEKLEPEHAEVIVMSRMLGMGAREIGERTGRSEGAARVLLCRALARLGTELDPSA